MRSLIQPVAGCVLVLAAAGCVGKGPRTSVTAVNLTGSQLVANNAAGLIGNNAGGIIANNAGGLTGVVRGPAAGLIGNNAGGLVAGNLAGLISNNSGGLISNNSGGLISNNSGGLISNNSGGWRLLAADELLAPVANAKVEAVDELGKPISAAPTTTDANGSYTILALGPSAATVFVRASFEQEGQPVTLLAAAPAPRNPVLADTPVDPAASIVAKKAAAAVADGKLAAAKLDARTLTAMAQEVRPFLNGKSVVAAALDRQDLGAKAFDAMVAQSPVLAGAVTGAAKDLAQLVPADASPVSVLAGGSAQGYADGAGMAARFNQPYGIVADATGVFAVEVGGARVRKVAADGTVATLAGSGKVAFADGAATAAAFNGPRGIAADGAGGFYVADSGNHRIRKVAADGTVTTLAGDGTAGFADGPAATARFNSPRGLAVGADGTLYVADTQNYRIRAIDRAGTVTTLAGSGTPAFADGAATAAGFQGPLGLALDPAGTLYVSDFAGHRLRAIALATRQVTTLAGTGTAGSGANQLNYPAGLAWQAGTLYVADSGSNTIRKLAKDGPLVTLDLGTPSPFNGPYGVALGPDGMLYVADTSNQRICKVKP